MSEHGRAPSPPHGSRTSELRRLFRGTFAPAVPMAPGTLLAGKYRVGGMLGEGGMGAVYQAQHVETGHLVAVKVMRPQHASDPSMAERFEREARMASRVRSPHVSSIHEFGTADDGTMYLVMELLRGKPLSRHLDDQVVLPWREAVRVIREAALGLHAVHSAGVIHRDLKPDNLFLCGVGSPTPGRVKLLDFGIAKEFAPDWAKGVVSGKPLTQVGTVLGTPLYMSPEAVTQSPLGPPTDLYALGAILFEMLTGRLLFEEEQAVILMGMHLRTKPDRVLSVRSDLGIPNELDELVDQLLAKEPRKRPKDAAAVAETLERIATSRPSTGKTGTFVAVSAAEHRRSAAAQPTELTGFDDMTIPRGPMPDVANDTAPGTADAEHAALDGVEPATFVEPLRTVSDAAAPAPRRSALVMGLVALVVLGGAAAAVGSQLGGPDEPTPVATPLPRRDPPVGGPETVPVLEPPVHPPETPPGPVAQITLSFELVPANATVYELVDDERRPVTLIERTLVLPRDGARHEFVAEARGRTSRPVAVTADEDRTVRLAIPRASTTPGGDTSSTSGGGGSGGGDIAREF